MKKTGIVLLLLFVFAQGFASVGKKQIRLRLQDTLSNLMDESDVYLDLGISPAYIAGVEDAPKKFDTDQDMPQLYSLTSDGVPCFSNVYGLFSSTVSIKLGFRVNGSSVYAISARLIDNFDPISIIQIEDKLTGTFYDLRQGAYVVNIDQPVQTTDRFILHISYPPLIQPEPSGCNNDDGSIAVLQDTSILWSSCQLYDAGMNYITAYNSIRGNFTFSGLIEGNYNLAFVYGIYSAVVPIHITGKQIIAGINVANTHVAVGDTVQFFSDAHNATHFAWDFGDSTRVEGVANAEEIFTEPGSYEVQLKCSNDQGCVAYAYITIVVTEPTGIAEADNNSIKIFAWQKQLSILMLTTTSSVYQLEIYNTAGQLIKQDKVSGNSTITLADKAAGVYMVRISAGDKNFVRKVFVD